MTRVMEAQESDNFAGSSGVLLYKVTDVMRMLNMSRSVIYDQMRRGRLRSVHEGRARLIPESAVREYVDLLVREARGAD